jgi:hypothetical protein
VPQAFPLEPQKKVFRMRNHPGFLFLLMAGGVCAAANDSRDFVPVEDFARAPLFTSDCLPGLFAVRMKDDFHPAAVPTVEMLASPPRHRNPASETEAVTRCQTSWDQARYAP